MDEKKAPAKFCVIAKAPKMMPHSHSAQLLDTSALPLAARHRPKDAVLVHEPALR